MKRKLNSLITQEFEGMSVDNGEREESSGVGDKTGNYRKKVHYPNKMKPPKLILDELKRLYGDTESNLNKMPRGRDWGQLLTKNSKKQRNKDSWGPKIDSPRVATKIDSPRVGTDQSSLSNIFLSKKSPQPHSTAPNHTAHVPDTPASKDNPDTPIKPKPIPHPKSPTIDPPTPSNPNPLPLPPPH